MLRVNLGEESVADVVVHAARTSLKELFDRERVVYGEPGQIIFS